LLARIQNDFTRCGVVGEATNKLVGYLAVVSRKLEAPLAITIQLTSAAGKSSLMDAVLAFMPEEERITLKGVALLDFDKATLKPQAREVLDDTIAETKEKLQSYHVEHRHITVTGHTDSVGSDAYNQRL